VKIICIGRNYVEHVKELQNALPENPVFFLKPDSSLLTNNKPFFIPAFSDDIHFEVEVVLKVGKLGRHIQEKFALNYIESLSVGVDFTARDIQHTCKEKGLPWEIAKSFDHSAPVGEFIPAGDFTNFRDINFSLSVNHVIRQKGNTMNMIFPFEVIISYVSKFITLKTGDLIFTGTPAGVGKVNKNDLLEGYLESRRLFSFSAR